MFAQVYIIQKRLTCSDGHQAVSKYGTRGESWNQGTLDLKPKTDITKTWSSVALYFFRNRRGLLADTQNNFVVGESWWPKLTCSSINFGFLKFLCPFAIPCKVTMALAINVKRFNLENYDPTFEV